MLAYADEVYVLTRSNNRTVIEADPLSRSAGLHFLYYDLPSWALKLKKQSWFRLFYFTLWQWGAYRLAAIHHRETPFDRVYHVTFAGMQAGSFMGRLGIPFVIGPIAGGERAPFRLRRGMPFPGKVRELMRDLGILVQRGNPLMRSALAAANRIFVTTDDSLCLIPPKWRKKTAVHLAVATQVSAVRNDKRRRPEFPQFVFAGNWIHLKGLHLAIRALAQVLVEIPDARLTLIGGGPTERQLRALAVHCGVAHAVKFAGRLPRQEFVDSLRDYTACIYPSLHDSGGFTVLESLQEGTPVVCLDLGGPGVMVNASCGFVVPTKVADEVLVVTRIANAMISLSTMTDAEWLRLSSGAKARASELTWADLTAFVAAGER
jgi:glycosyltransferase involved in cell wall biosynthesis